MPVPNPSDLELQVLTVLWNQGPLSVSAVRNALPDGKDRAYTTVLSVLQVMQKKGLVGHTRQGNAHIFHPLVQRKQVLRPFMKQLLRNLFRGSPAEAVQSLLDSSRVSDEELAEIRQLIEEATRKPRPTGGDQ